MRLNPDAVRDILLYIESDLQFDSFFSLKDFTETTKLSNYDLETIKYTLLKLSETDYLKAKPIYGSNTLVDFSIGMLTWEGHKFLDTIRDKEVWSNTKKVAEKLESVSISILSNISVGVVNHLIDKTMGY